MPASATAVAIAPSGRTRYAKPVSPIYGTATAIIGMTLINSRTQPLAAEDEPQRRRNARWLAWTLGVVATLALLAIIIDIYR